MYGLYLLCTGEVIDNELFADPRTPAPAAAAADSATAQQDAAG